MAEIKFESVTKVYADGTCAVRSVDLEVDDGQLLVLVGPSGCGKTTLLRMVAGLEQITDGVVRIGGRVVNDVPPKSRDIAMVFQNYALYPHMSVYDNMAFSLKLRRLGRDRIDERVRPTAATLGLLDRLTKRPRALSGGQRQRVAMGRAIVRQPQAFLMDEPLSNLDAKLRVQMRAEIGRIQRELGVTTIYVTHDQTEAMTLGDLVAVMRQGVIQQLAEPEVLFDDPKNVFVAGFIGSPAMNLVEATIDRDGDSLAVVCGSIRLAVPPAVIAARPALAGYVGRKLIFGIRPEDIEDADLAQSGVNRAHLTAAVELRETLGREALLYFTVPGVVPVLTDDVKELAADTDAAALGDLEEQRAARSSRFVARVSARTNAREGEPVVLAVDTNASHFFDLETGQAISRGSC